MLEKGWVGMFCSSFHKNTLSAVQCIEHGQCMASCLVSTPHETHRVGPTKMNIDLDELNVTLL